MTTISSAARRTRRAVAGLGIVAGSILVVAPVAGAERPSIATGAESDTSYRGPSARSSAPSGVEPQAQQQGVTQSSESTRRYEHTLCHRTGSAADPYVQITVAFRTADGEVVSSDGGHESHDGPVFDPEAMGEGDTWGDIIPPFTTPDGVHYPGKNWPAGERTFDNGCVPVGPTAPADGTEDGDRTPDPAGVPATRGSDGSAEEQDPEDERRQQDDATERSVTSTRRPDAHASGSSVGGSADAVEQRIRRAGGATGDIAAVLGQQVTRDPDDNVVPTAESEPTLVTDLARTDSGFLVVLMLGLSALIGGYVTVDAIRDRMRRTD